MLPDGKRCFLKNVLEGSISDRVKELQICRAKISAIGEADEIKYLECWEFYKRGAEERAAEDEEFGGAWKHLPPCGHH